MTLEINTLEIGKNEYTGNISINTVILSKNTNIINECAFFRCYNLSNINLDYVINIKLGAFSHCKNLTSVNLSSCKEIGFYAFEHCNLLKNIIIPEKFKNKLKYIFKGCILNNLNITYVAN